MAQFRLSASVIKRSEGRCATAAAAYRAGARIRDERTGLIHDFRNRRGIDHTEIMAPTQTPDWMLDREKLWNAVEAAERRKDGQLTREIQLSLPHELDRDNRLGILRDFVRENFVDHGMIADVAVHLPIDGDPRNHHAHVLLTMRSLTSEGFGNKNRGWSSPEMAEKWRKSWADHQNDAFERHGLEVRVDHRSYMRQGVDREPTQHLGPSASEMERSGERSRIGEENRAIEDRNAHRTDLYRRKAEAILSEPVRSPLPYRKMVATESEIYQRELTRRERQWAERAAQLRETIDHKQRIALLDLDQRKHQHQVADLKADQHKRNHVMKATMAAEVDAIDRRLQARGITRLFRDIFGRTRADRERQDRLNLTIDGIRNREAEELSALRIKHENDRQRVIEKHDRQRAHLEKVLATQQAQRDRTLSEARGYSVRDPKELRQHFARPSQGRREDDRPPPKPIPTMQPAPPRGAGPSPTPSGNVPDAQFAARAADWAKTPAGRKATEGYEKDRERILRNPDNLSWAKPTTPAPKLKPEFDKKKDRERD